MKLVIGRYLAVAAVGLALTCAVASATPQSTPAIMQVSAKQSSARLIVMAGATGAEAGFTVDWMTQSDFDAAGGWPAAGDLRLHTGDFFGVPVWIVQGTSGDFTLGPVQYQAIALGELFDESGVVASNTDELNSSTQYVVRVTAKASGSYTASAPSTDFSVTTTNQVQNCTFTQGYWKTHPDAWPVTSLTLGTVTYSKSQLLSILNTPASGNGLVILAHQLIAALLNIANGADATSIASTISAVNAQIGSLVVPPVGGGFLTPSAVNANATTLDNYNNGLIGPGHCATPASNTTWGTLKATYRN